MNYWNSYAVNEVLVIGNAFYEFDYYYYFI